MQRFTGYRVIVTGAGSGIGRAIATRFVAEGARVVIADISEETAHATAKELGPQATPAVVDVAHREEVDQLISSSVAHLDGLDVMVNNVGVHHLFQPALDLPDSEFDRMLEVNTKSLLYTTRAAAPHLRDSGRGSICTIASIGAVVIRPGASLYAASKSAAIAFTKATALELAPQVRVNCVLPTSTPTGLLTSVPGVDADSIQERYARNADLLPMKRLGTGEDIAGAVAFLSSPDASFITGIALPVDGGRSAGGG